MLNKWKTLFTGLLFVAAFGQAMAQVELKIGEVTVSPNDMTSATCIQVPLFLNDGAMSDRDIRSVTVTVEVTDTGGIIDGGVATNMIISNAFATDPASPGIQNPGVDLSNDNGTSSPTCTNIVNQATLGTGPAVDFLAEIANAPSMSTVNAVGGNNARKQLFLFDFGGAQVVSLNQGEDVLIGVLEIPIIANPGASQILINAVPLADVAGGNTLQLDGGGILDLTLPGAASAINIFEAIDCDGASSNTEITYLDPQAGGIGGEIDFSFPNLTGVDQISISGTDGYTATVPVGADPTTHSISTQGDGHPDTADTTFNYTIGYQVEFPPASGNYVTGNTCSVTPAWAAPTAVLSFDAVPVLGQPTNLDVVLTNALWDGTKFGTVSLPGGGTVDLTAPSSTSGNSMTFLDVHVIAAVAVGDVGAYTFAGTGPGGQANAGATALTLEDPENQTVCDDITAGIIGGGVIRGAGDPVITLAGNAGTVDFTVIYNGTTYDDLPAGAFALPNLVGDVTDVTIRANGFDSGGNPIFDEIICTLDYVEPTCNNATQNPDTNDAVTYPDGVDVGTVVTLTLDTVNAVSVTIDGVEMTPGSDPNTNAAVTWTATHTAIADQTLTAVVTNTDGETVECTWTININCAEPTFVVTPQFGDTTVTVEGTPGCTYNVIFTTDDGTSVNPVTIPEVDSRGLGTTAATFSLTVPADAEVCVVQAGITTCAGAAGAVVTVPTLGEWGLIAFITLMMGFGIVIRRRNA